MRTLDELRDTLKTYGAAEYVYDADVGYIAWHFITGGNLEVLYFEAAEKGRGLGRELYRRLALELLGSGRRPYHSVVGYRRSGNQQAARFYDKLGWTQVDLGQSVYRDGGTTLMWITWADLLKNLGLAGQPE